jgi:hypothetical protein
MEVKRYIVSYIVYKPNSSEADYINNHILNVFKYIFNQGAHWVLKLGVQLLFFP